MMHQYVCRGWGRNSPHYIVFYLYVVFTVKYEVFNVRINDRKVGITFVAIAFQGKIIMRCFCCFYSFRIWNIFMQSFYIYNYAPNLSHKPPSPSFNVDFLSFRPSRCIRQPWAIRAIPNNFHILLTLSRGDWRGGSAAIRIRDLVGKLEYFPREKSKIQLLLCF